MIIVRHADKCLMKHKLRTYKSLIRVKILEKEVDANGISKVLIKWYDDHGLSGKMWVEGTYPLVIVTDTPEFTAWLMRSQQKRKEK